MYLAELILHGEPGVGEQRRVSPRIIRNLAGAREGSHFVVGSVCLDVALLLATIRLRSDPVEFRRSPPD